MKLKLLIFLFSVVQISYAQENKQKIDSLKNIIATTKVDTAKVWTLIALGNEIEGPKPDEAYSYYKQAENISRKINYPRGIIKAISNFTYILDMKSKLAESKPYYEEAVALATKHKLGILEGKSLANLGAWYQRSRNLTEATSYFLKAAKILDKYNELETSLLLKANTANIYRDLKRYEESISICREVQQKTKNDATVVQVLITEGNCISDLEKWKLSILPFEKALIISEKLQNKDFQIVCLNNLARSYTKTKQWEKSFLTSKKAIQISNEIESIDGVRIAYHHLGYYYLFKKQADSSYKYFNESLKIAKKNNILEDIGSNYSGMSYVYLLNGDVNNFLRFAEIADSLEVLYTGDRVLDSSMEIEAKYNVAKKQNEILQKNIALDKANTRNWFLGGGLVVFALLASLFFNNYKKDQQTKALEAELNTQKTERQRIASEMHDELGGNLTSLMYLAHNLKDKASKNKEVDKIIQTSGNISDSINEIVWALNQEQNLLADWVFYVRGKTAELFENAGVHYTYTISEPMPERTLSNIEKRNLYLVVKEAINNAIKHSKANTYQVNMDFTSGINISIKDNGIGFIENGTPKAGGGNGLKNMSRRMEEIGGSIAWSNGEGTTVEIKL
jgi:two-component system, NarL family, sensor kinase